MPELVVFVKEAFSTAKMQMQLLSCFRGRQFTSRFILHRVDVETVLSLALLPFLFRTRLFPFSYEKNLIIDGVQFQFKIVIIIPYLFILRVLNEIAVK